MWERVDGGYRVLDWEAVEVCLDQYARSGERTRTPLPKAADVTWTLCMTRCISKTSPDDCKAW
jgi:hypothetical protein